MAPATAGSSSRAVLPLLPALALAVFVLLLAPAVAGEEAAAPLEFHVGGPRGWRVPDGNTSYGWWATNNRFRVGDHLLFRYANDSVLLVERPAFDACNTTAPLATFNDGATTFPLDRPGFFCFISGEPGHCEQGQKLVVRVMVHLAAPGPASAPGAPGQPGHVGGRPRPPGLPGATSDATTAAAAAAGVAVAAALAAFVSLVLMIE
ncbi:hypothetical protein PAHAL_5G415600 [Panicum hallii]|uniref:Phytocyanin domain-containing protein n=1 Tax=Panicum hallii TaxID=206008 RepID=A0A2S3HWW8_9POAL|nr:early nodulin-like protein 1 [Panicum hallii]PAN31382.1 hypothetical protein PAHAL_5G415600 [Panicum hallii]